MGGYDVGTGRSAKIYTGTLLINKFVNRRNFIGVIGPTRVPGKVFDSVITLVVLDNTRILLARAVVL